LREPVVALVPMQRLHPTRPPTLSKERGGVRLEVWLPKRTLSPGEWLTVHVRITNERKGPIHLGCYPTRSRLRVHELFDRGRVWTGNAASFKRAVLELTWLGSPQLANGPASCPQGETGGTRLRPGGHLEYDARLVPRYGVRDQPLPAGRLPLTTTLSYATNDWGVPRRTVTVGGEVELDGPPWPWASPQQIVDAALADPRFAAWLDDQGPGCCRSATFEVVEAPGSIYWPEHGFEGPAPDGTVYLSTFPSSVLLDPWTAQVISFDPG